MNSADGSGERVVHDFNAILAKKRLIDFFALINLCLIAGYQSQNVVYGAYISRYL